MARLTKEEFQKEINYSTGTEFWYRHSFWKFLVYTDGIKLVIEEGGRNGANWLINSIGGYLLQFKNKIDTEERLYFEFNRVEGGICEISMYQNYDKYDKNYKFIETEKKVIIECIIPYSDLQIDNLKLIYFNDVLCLPNEQ